MTSSNQLRSDRPAHDFTESYPLGNGRLGACIYGETLREQVILNESSMWSGSPQDADREGASDYLPQIRSLLRQGKNYEAQKLFAEHFTCSGKGTDFAHGTEVPFGCYQVLGRLNISYFQAVSSGRQDSCCQSAYQRILDLEEAKSSVSFCLGGKSYTREYLISADYQAIFLHLTCSEPGQIDISCGLDRDECFETAPLAKEGFPGISMEGQLADGCSTEKGVRYCCMMTVKSRGGRILQESQRVRVCEADEAWIILTARTDLSGFLGKEPCDPRESALSDLQKACRADWQDVVQKHRDWYSSQYHTMELSFDSEPSDLTTAELLQKAAAGSISPALVTLYVQYARYLMISCSQPDGFPANLQGIWADEILTPWNGDWHLNAQQMIYWLSEKAGLSHCHLPYLKLTEALTGPGAKTAKTYYGAKGWLAHTCTNPWGFTSPCEDASWGSTTGSPAWQCHHLWEHYLYTLDTDYLKWAYPVMKGAMEFYLDILVEDEQGRLVTSPSSSPENWFLDKEGRPCALCEGPAYDRGLILALADSCIQAAAILNRDFDFSEKLKQIRKKLAPLEIGSDGRLMEWSQEYQEVYPYHRHLSHLWAVYPGNLISMEQTPEYGKAAAKSLHMRGTTTAGWAIALRGCLHARLRHSEEALSCFGDAMKYATARNMMNLAYHCDETEAHPPLLDLDHCRYPFQIDGNQGNAAIILLMLLDDAVEFQEDLTMTIHLYLLPALPDLLKNGSAKGLRTKGNMTLDMTWKEGKITSLTISGPVGNHVVLHDNQRVQELILKAPVTRVF